MKFLSRTRRFLLLTFATLGIVLAAACVATGWWLTRVSEPHDYGGAYHAALDRYPGTSRGIEAGLERFGRTFADLTAANIGQRIAALYAPEMYFNDTLKTFTANQGLARYMSDLGAGLSESSVHIDQTLIDDTDVFVRWTMHFESIAAGQTIRSRSIGMTHLRFDADGRVLVHQDFWDPAAGLYRHLPVTGPILEMADQQMTAE